MTRRLVEPLRRLFLTLLLLRVLPLFITTADESEKGTDQECSEPSSSLARTNYFHLVVLVHGYLGSDREQEYLSEALIEESRKLIKGPSCRRDRHEILILKSKANVQTSTTDGIAEGGKRLAAEISEWVAQQAAEIELSQSDTDSTVVTFSLIGNSLGGLYGRYALAQLDFFGDDDGNDNEILPLVFCTTSSPHIGVSRNTFIELPRWVEPHVATAFQQKTMDDLFGVNNSTVVMDMCQNSKDRSKNDYLFALQQFQKRIAVANVYKTDFLVSVSSGAFLSLESDSVHHRQDAATSSTRLIRDMGHLALQVVTEPSNETTEPEDDDDDETNTTLKSCVDSLDKLGWHKIFIDTRNVLPGFMVLRTPELEARPSYTSKELKEHFDTFGTLLPIAHPLNMANAKTDWYRKLTKSGQPIVDALAELLMLDMVEYSEKQHHS